MGDHRYKVFVRTFFFFAVMFLVLPSIARGQSLSLTDATIARRSAPAPTICEETAAPAALKDALRQVCLRKPRTLNDSSVRNTIVIGFVGGFVKRDNPKHPEVQFAAYLRDRYPSGMHVEVFSNHEGHEALRQVERLLDTDRDGSLSAAEKQQARIIIYGHSWGASQTVAFASQLGQQGIPVLLTVQLDSIAKPGQNDSIIPPNVASAVNFYQPRGFLHGRPEILAADPSRTKIIGNFRMTYRNQHINCDNYPWIARTFNRPHHEIENDPRVWDRLASLIDSEFSSQTSPATTPETSDATQFSH